MELICPVCGQALSRKEASWQCENRHSFDVARQGYVNLLTVDRKHARHPGDTKEQVAARRTFLDAGFYLPIVQTVCQMIVPLAPKAVLDTGCGEGYYLTRLQEQLPKTEFAGIDISKDAVRFAAVRNKNALWLTATAAALPFPAESFDCVLSMFALTVAGEFARVLRQKGWFLQVLAGPEHLMGLKNIIYPEILHKEKILHPDVPGFFLDRTETLEFTFTVDENAQVQNLLSMTPHYFRISRDGAARLAATDHLTDTAQVIFNLYRKEDIHAGAITASGGALRGNG